MTTIPKVEQVAQIYAEIQKQLCSTLEQADGKAIFEENIWEKEIGSGITCVIRNGAVIEKGGVNYSFVKGEFNPQMERLLGEKAESFAATGISSIVHPINPYVPIIHTNIRYFALNNGTEWFGGGIDLSPHYVDVHEAQRFHRRLKHICDKYNFGFYPRFKKWADDYFFIRHRNESRGIGGIFFDRLKPDDEIDFEQLLLFTTDLGSAYADLYAEIVKDKKGKAYSPEQKEWQQLRRGRYVEFNLVYDRGTKFGFESNGNTEAILVSLPASASWEYNHVVKPGSDEYETLQLLKKDIDWVNFE